MKGWGSHPKRLNEKETRKNTSQAKRHLDPEVHLICNGQKVISGGDDHDSRTIEEKERRGLWWDGNQFLHDLLISFSWNDNVSDHPENFSNAEVCTLTEKQVCPRITSQNKKNWGTLKHDF